jgi:hypothetical protein
MSEPQQLMIRAATAALRDAGKVLRERGWPCELIVDRVPEIDSYAVSLRIELPRFPIPIEAGGHWCEGLEELCAHCSASTGRREARDE